MGRIDDGIAIAAENPEVILTCFGDMMRIPGSTQSFLEAKAGGADIRMVYSPLDALRIAKSNPERTVVFFAIGFETTAPSTALTLKRAKAEGVTNFLCVCNHVTIVPPLRALLDSPDLRLDGFIGPGHVSTVVGVRPFEFIPAEYGKPLVTAGFEPLDVLQTIRMILAQLRKGEAKVENQYKRVVPYEGNPAALKVMAEVFELRPHFEWRGLGFISQSALKLSEAYADFDAELRYSVPGVRVADPKACQCGEVLEGRHQAVGVQGLRHRVHARARDRHLHGFAGGRLRRLLQLRPLRAGQGGGGDVTEPTVASEKRIGAGRPSAPDREQRVLEIIETARAKRPRFKDSAVNMSHGAGGKATQTLIEGLYVPAFESDALAELGDSGVVQIAGTLGRHDHRHLRRQAAPVPRRVDRRARRLRHRERPRRRRRQGAGAQPRVRPRGGPRRRRPTRGGRCDRPHRRRGRSLRRHRRHQGRRARAGRRHVRLHDRASARSTRALRSAPARSRPATASSSRRRSASTARRSCSRAASWASRRTSNPTAARSGRSPTLCSTPPDPTFARMRDATRGGVASALNELARASAVGITVREASIPVIPEVEGASELLGIDPMYVANEGVMVAFVAPDAADAALAALRSVPGCEAAAEIAEVVAETPGMVLVETAFGGRRVMDLLAGDPLPRIC